MNQPSALADRIAELEKELAHTRAALQALVRRELDAVTDAQGAILWRAAQAQLQRAASPAADGEAREDSSSTNERLRIGEERFRLLAKATNHAIWDWNLLTDELFWSDGFVELFGYGSVDTPTIDDWRARIHPEDRASVLAKLEATLRGDSSDFRSEYRYMRHDGRASWVEDRGYVIRDARGIAVRMIGGMSDVTARKEAASAQARLAAIVEHSEDAIFSKDLDGIITTWNHAACRLYGYDAPEIVGQHISVLTPPGFEHEPMMLIARIRSGESVVRFETTRMCKDGRTVDVAVTLSPLRDEQGQIVGASVISRDLTERKCSEAALRRAEEQLAHSQKLEAIGALAGGIAHDFNNLLSVILSCGEFALDEVAQGGSTREDIEEICRAARRARELTSQLLAFGRQQAIQPRMLSLNEVLSQLESMLRRIVRADIDFSLRAGQGLGSIHADPARIEQVVMNLVVNAVDAMPSGGCLEILTDRVELGRAHESATGLAPGAYVRLTVRDSGVGMDAATRARIFEPFFTTKVKGKGTGLGLSTVYGIVTQMGGSIEVESESGRGTTFFVYIPTVDQPACADDPEPELRPSRGCETILLVEDDDQVRRIARTILERAGYVVLGTHDSREAVLICERHTSEIHLLLTDMVMPTMSGRQLAERVAELRPE